VWQLGSALSRPLLSDNYIACDDARERQEEGSLRLGEIVLVYHNRRLVVS